MAKYKFTGARFLRKYTASRANSVEFAAADAQKIVDSLCTVPWQAVAEKSASPTYHTSEIVYKDPDTDAEVSGLEMNVRIRDEFDAAMFCAEHVGGTHRAYANAAVYRYVVPTAAQGATLTALTATVTSDNYNSKGCRLHVWTSDDGDIPMSCRAVRGEDETGAVVADGSTAAGVAVRTTKEVATKYKDGVAVETKTYWYPTTESATLSPAGGLTLKKYLFLAVALESYATTRGNWLEGCSYIANSVVAEFAAAVSGWTDGETYDLSEGEPVSFICVSGGIVPSVPAGACTGARTVAVRRDANLIVEADGSQSEIRDAASTAAANGLSRLYAEFFAANDAPTVAADATAQTGAAFDVCCNREQHVSPDDDIPLGVDVYRIESQVLVVPVALPHTFNGRTLRVSYAKPDYPDGFKIHVWRSNSYATSLTADALKAPGLYDGFADSTLANGLVYVGEIDLSATQTDLAFAYGSGDRVATLVFVAWMPPESVNVKQWGAIDEPTATISWRQGTNGKPFFPDVAIISK